MTDIDFTPEELALHPRELDMTLALTPLGDPPAVDRLRYVVKTKEAPGWPLYTNSRGIVGVFDSADEASGWMSAQYARRRALGMS